MTDETFDGPDANDVRRHAKKLYTEKQYRERYNRLTSISHRQSSWSFTICRPT